MSSLPYCSPQLTSTEWVYIYADPSSYSHSTCVAAQGSCGLGTLRLGSLHGHSVGVVFSFSATRSYTLVRPGVFSFSAQHGVDTCTACVFAAGAVFGRFGRAWHAGHSCSAPILGTGALGWRDVGRMVLDTCQGCDIVIVVRSSLSGKSLHFTAFASGDCVASCDVSSWVAWPHRARICGCCHFHYHNERTS